VIEIKEVFLKGVEIIDKTMGNNEHEVKIPKNVGEEIADVRLLKTKGILLMSNNGFFRRLWYFISNPFRYIFTGKIRY